MLEFFSYRFISVSDTTCAYVPVWKTERIMKKVLQIRMPSFRLVGGLQFFPSFFYWADKSSCYHLLYLLFILHHCPK